MDVVVYMSRAGFNVSGAVWKTYGVLPSLIGAYLPDCLCVQSCHHRHVIKVVKAWYILRPAFSAM